MGDEVLCSAAVDTVPLRSPNALAFYSGQDEWRTKTLAANIDTLVIMHASHPRFNPWFVWKALLASHVAGVHPIVIRNKTDLTDGSSEAERFLASLSALGYETHAISAESACKKTIEELDSIFNGRRSLLVGQSGMENPRS